MHATVARDVETQLAPSPEEVIHHYQQVYNHLYRKMPRVRYLGNAWFQVNGEIVHRQLLIDEVHRLYALAREANARKQDGNLIRRIIARLRGN